MSYIVILLLMSEIRLWGENNMLNDIHVMKDYLFKYLRQYKDKTAFILSKNGDQITYGEFLNNIYAGAQYLMKFSGENIALIGENSYEWLVAFFAIICSGKCAIPIDTELSDVEIMSIIDQTKCKVIIHSKTFDDLMNNDPVVVTNSILCLQLQNIFSEFLKNQVEDTKYTDEIDLPYSNPDKVCIIVFTSGTLNKPKGVMLTEDNIMAVIQGAHERLKATGNVFAILPFNHTYSLICGILGTLSRGATIIINDRVKNFIKNVKKYKPHMIFLVPLFVEKIYGMISSEIENKKQGKTVNRIIKFSRLLLKIKIDCRRLFFSKIHNQFGGNLDTIICGGAPIKEEYIQFFRDIGINILNGYGITECSPLVAVVSNINQKSFRGNSVGKAISTCEVIIHNPDNEGNGEVWVRGRNTMKGYFNDTASTQKVFENNWFKTGDIGRMDEDGYIYIVGRIKNMILRSNGKNVYPEEIELELNQSKFIDDVVVYCDENDAIVAEIYPKPEKDGEIEVSQLINTINEKLPLYGQINKIIYRDKPFEKTTTKKIKRYKSDI
jgi:long-chain acyl-CoA synthetase